MKLRTFKILLAEDNNKDIEKIKELFVKIEQESVLPRKFQIESVSTLKDAENKDLQKYDILLLDLNLPDSSTEKTIETFVESNQYFLPIIILTGLDNEIIAIKSVEKGAQDYLIKTTLSSKRLLFSIEHAIQRHKNLITVKNQAFIDPLTGLFNRRGFEEFSSQQILLAKRNKKKLLLCYVDMDGMKQINDNYGHDEGDRAILYCVEILKQTFRKSDIIARLGGDEFAVLAINVDNNEENLIRNRLKLNVEQFNRSKKADYNISLSLGFSFFDVDSPFSLTEHLKIADKNMYKHKELKYKKGILKTKIL